MTESATCPQCGAPLPASTLAGLCPRCVRRVALAADSVGDHVSDASASAPRWTPPSVEELAALLPADVYRVASFIGRGGMGAVYQAEQLRLQRKVAIKVMRREREGERDFAGRFQREALTLAKLSHPGIVNVHDFGEAGPDLLYIVMEFVDGADLMEAIRTNGMTQDLTLQIVPQICDALQYAHDQGIVHRDIKPSNILITREGRIKMADFGLAKLMEMDAGELTHTGAAMGTPDYAAPEQFTPGAEVDHRADIYALGVMIYQMITGTLPRGAWKPPSQSAKVDPRWDGIVNHAMQQRPQDRYATAGEVKTDVTGISTGSHMQRGRAGGNRAGPLRMAMFFSSLVVVVTASSYWLGHLRSQGGADAMPPGAVMVGDDTMTFRSHRYQYVSGTHLWKTAREEAEKLGGHLAVITSQEENDAIVAAFKKHLGGQWWSAWLGGECKEQGGKWEWINGEPFSFADWDVTEPNSDRFPAHICLFHPHIHSPDYHWDDTPETSASDTARRGFIVEWEHL